MWKLINLIKDKYMKKELFVEYRNIAAQIKELTARKTELSGELVKEMKKSDYERVNADFGTFSIVKRTNFKYTGEAIVEITGYKDKIKKAEEKAVIEGNVLESVTESVKFLPKKKKVENK